MRKRSSLARITASADLLSDIADYGPAEPDTIQYWTLELLENTGVCVKDPYAVQLLKSAGCRIKSDDIVLIPNGLVESTVIHLENEEQKGIKN